MTTMPHNETMAARVMKAFRIHPGEWMTANDVSRIVGDRRPYQGAFRHHRGVRADNPRIAQEGVPVPGGSRVNLPYGTKDTTYTDESVVSLASDCGKILIFTADYGPSHHKYLIGGRVLKRCGLTSPFYRPQRIGNWRIAA